MKKLLRRLFIVGFYVASLAAVAVVTFFYARNFTGFGPMPDRLSFGRRLVGVPDGDARRFQFFYATNRSTAPENRAFDGDGRAISNTISAGTFDVRISPDLTITPWAWIDEDLMKIVGRTDMTQEAAMTQLQKAVAASPEKSLLIIVWGFRDRFQTAALKTAYTAFVLDINTPMLMFDWPGNQGEGTGGYRASRQMSYDSGPALGETLAHIVRESGAKRIWLMGSSLGCQTICEAFSWMMNESDLADSEKEIEHVVLNAPDVSAREFDERFSAEINALSKHLTTYVASNDQALLVSKFVNRGDRRLGRPGVAQPTTASAPQSPDVESQLQYAVDLLELQDKGLDGVSVVDATPVNRTRNLHHFFTDSPEFFDDLYRHLLDPQDPIARRLYSVPTEGGSDFFILWDD